MKTNRTKSLLTREMTSRPADWEGLAMLGLFAVGVAMVVCCVAINRPGQPQLVEQPSRTNAVAANAAPPTNVTEASSNLPALPKTS